MSLQCRLCETTLPDSEDTTLAEERWGWVMLPDPGLGHDHCGEPIPGYFYACPDHSDAENADAFAWARNTRTLRAGKEG